MIHDRKQCLFDSKIDFFLIFVEFVGFVQEDYRPEEEDEEEGNDGDIKSFFAPSGGTSFHADSFLQLNLSRPLLRACEALGYSKPTPIQVFIFSFVYFLF